MNVSVFNNYAKNLLNVAMPIIMGNLGFILIGAGDVLIAGRHSTDTLAAVSIATAILNCIMTFGVCLVAAASPVISNYRGSGVPAKRYFYPTIRFSQYVALVIMLLILFSIPVIDLFGFQAELVPFIKQYMLISAFAVFGGYLHVALKEFLQAFEIVFFPNLLTVFSVFLNIVLNLILVFGFWKIPSLGVIGLAIASLLVRYFMGFVLLIYCFKIMKFSDFCEVKDYYKNLVKIGLPMSVAVLVEFVAFNGVSVIMGRIDGIYAAAQNLLCTLTSVSFMIPFAISNAISVKVGYANGAKNIIDVKRYSFIGISMSVLFMAFSSLVFASAPNFLVKIFSSDPSLLKVTVPIVYFLACFQIFDGLQVSLSGVFKGIKKTKIVMISNFIGYLLVSLPLGYIFALKFGLGLSGFWVGLIASAIILCMIMFVMMFRYFRKFEYYYSQEGTPYT